MEISYVMIGQMLHLELIDLSKPCSMQLGIASKTSRKSREEREKWLNDTNGDTSCNVESIQSQMINLALPVPHHRAITLHVSNTCLLVLEGLDLKK